MYSNNLPKGSKHLKLRLDVNSRSGLVHLQPAVILLGEVLEKFNRLAKDFQGKQAKGTTWVFTPAVLEDLVNVLEEAGFDLMLTDAVYEELMHKREGIAAHLDVARSHVDRANKFLARVGAKLWAFQETDIPTLAAADRMILAWEPGLGKGGASLSAAAIQAIGSAAGGAVFVIPPDLVGMWVEEIAKWRPDISVFTVPDTASFRWPAPGELVLTTYMRLPPLEADVIKARRNAQLTGKKARKFVQGDTATALAKEVPPNTVLVFDEAAALRNSKTHQSKRARALCKGVLEAGGKVWLLTATPIENNVDLAEMLKVLGVFTRIFGAGDAGWFNFCAMSGARKQMIRVKGGMFREVLVWRDENGDPYPTAPELPALVAPYILRRKREDVFTDLPPKVRQIIPIPVGPNDHKILSEIVKRLKEQGLTPEQYARLVGGEDRAELELKKKIDFTTLTALRRDVAVAKFPHLEKLLDNIEYPGQPLLVMSNFRAPVEALAGRTGPDGKQWAVISGDVNNKTREQIRTAFRNHELAGVAMTTATGGTGHTFLAGNRMVFLDMPLAARDLLQAEDRLRPHLQKESCHYHYLVYDHPVDKLVIDVLLRKLHNQENIIDTVGSIWAKGTPRKFRAERGPGNRVYRGPSTSDESDTVRTIVNQLIESPAATGLAEVWSKHHGWTELQWRIAECIVNKEVPF